MHGSVRRLARVRRYVRQFIKVAEPHPYNPELMRITSYAPDPNSRTWLKHNHFDVPKGGFEEQGAIHHKVAANYGIRHGGSIEPALRAANVGTGNAWYSDPNEGEEVTDDMILKPGHPDWDNAEEVTDDMIVKPKKPRG